MDTKVCKLCGVERDQEEYGHYIKRDGTKGYRNVCKICRNSQFLKNRNKSTKTTTAPKIEKNTVITKTINNEGKLYKMLTDKELENLKLLAQNSDGLLKLLDNKINLYMDENKANRIKKSITLDKNIHNKLKEHCKKSNFNLSDMINIVLRKGLEFMD